MLASCHIMAHTTDWVVYLVCRSFSHSEKLCMGPGPPKLTQEPWEKGVTMHGHTVPERVWPRSAENANSASAPTLCP